MSGGSLRRAAIFLAVASLGLALALLLAGGRRHPGGERSALPVVDVPEGTEIQGPGGVPGISLVEADDILVSPVQEVLLDDGARVQFRSMVLRGKRERPLPSPDRSVRRASISDPVLHLLPVPRTRRDYAAAASAVPTTLRAPEGILESGPGDALRLSLRGGVAIETVREGTPWSFRSTEADADLQARTFGASGAVSLESPMLRVEGLGLRAADAGRTLSMPGGARGTVSDSRGVRLAGGEQGGETRFRCAGELLLALRPPAAGAAPAPGKEAWRLVLDREAVVEQASGRLSADRVEIDVLRPTGREGGDTVVESVRAEGAVALEGTGRGRDLRAAGSSLRARPLEGGATEVYLDGEPVVAVREVEGGPSGRSVEIRGRSPARFVFPEADGPVAAWFRGGAVAAFVEPGAKEGDPPLRRDLSASSLALRARREGDRTLLEEVLAEGEAVLREGGRTARADRALYRPLEGGASLTRLEGAVAVSWPDAGALDPLAALSPGEAPEGAPGVLLLSTPGRVVVELPPGSDATTGAHFAADGGVTLRRAVGEREVYRLTCASADARLHPGSRGIATLAAAGSVRLDGREEGPSGRAYALAGDALDVRGDPSTREARTAEVRGTPGKARAEASFTGEDGRPFSVAADVLRFDRATGEFRAEGGVRGKGVLPEGGGAGLPGGNGGAAEIACGLLEGRLAGVGAGKGTEGGTRVLALTARDAVTVSTARERATGEALAYDAAEGTVLLRGDPAKVIATSRDAAAELGLVDRFESPAMALRIRDGEILEARADEGGLLVSHRAAGTAKGSPPPERYEARCRGPLLHVPGSTTLRGGVTLVHSRWKDGAFRTAERLEGAEEISVLHPPGRAAAGKVERAIATSGRGGIEIASEADGWRAEGVSKVDFDPSGSALLLESSPGAPRFRVRSADGLMTCRRITFDYVRGTFREGVGVTIEGGGR